ncbi:type II toxin-antitoxin system HipA family toxin, partial [Thioclava sp. BHET1]
FWLMGATDGHAKNFSLFIGPGGSYHMTPLYDILSAQPSLIGRRIERKQMKLAMSVGDRRHYRVDQIHGRHFLQTATRGGLSKARALALLEEIAGRVEAALDALTAALPEDFPEEIHDTIRTAIIDRARGLAIRPETDA